MLPPQGERHSDLPQLPPLLRAQSGSRGRWAVSLAAPQTSPRTPRPKTGSSWTGRAETPNFLGGAIALSS